MDGLFAVLAEQGMEPVLDGVLRLGLHPQPGQTYGSPPPARLDGQVRRVVSLARDQEREELEGPVADCLASSV